MMTTGNSGFLFQCHVNGVFSRNLKTAVSLDHSNWVKFWHTVGIMLNALNFDGFSTCKFWVSLQNDIHGTQQEFNYNTCMSMMEMWTGQVNSLHHVFPAVFTIFSAGIPLFGYSNMSLWLEKMCNSQCTDLNICMSTFIHVMWSMFNTLTCHTSQYSALWTPLL